MTALNNGFMNDSQIKKAKELQELVIYPYRPENLTPVGYNLSFSRFIISMRKRTFVKLLKDKKDGKEWYFYLKPHETVLVLTREAIWVSLFIGGIFQSKVGMVIKGLGHVSTTLDPGWQGQLLVPLNNPTKNKVKIVIAKEDCDGRLQYNTFITMILFSTQNAACTVSDNKSGRVELLEQVLEGNHHKLDSDIKAILQNIKQTIGYPQLNDDLNDPSKRDEKIDKFEKDYALLIQAMDNAFDDVNKVSIRAYNRHIIIYWIIFITSFSVLLIAAYAGFTVNEGHYKDVTNILVSIIIPFTMLFLNHIKDKFI